jgi:hypothetical protein
MRMAAASLNATTATKIAQEVIIPALNRNTSALLTLATLLLAQGNQVLPTAKSAEEAAEKILEIFNGFVGP